MQLTATQINAAATMAQALTAKGVEVNLAIAAAKDLALGLTAATSQNVRAVYEIIG